MVENTIIEKPNLKDIVRQLDALHFEKVLTLLQDNPNLRHEDPFWFDMIQAKAYRGLYQYPSALAVLDQIHPSNPQQQAWLVCEKGKLLFAMGRIQDAFHVMESSISDISLPFMPDLPLALASLYAQEGQVQKALEEIEPVISYFDKILKPDVSIYIEMCTLLGDLYTFTNDFSKASFWYQKGLQNVPNCISENWQPLRMALLENNLADLYEQEEDWTNALACYQRAESWLQKLKDSEISDLSSYRMEILFSHANTLANMDLYDEAIELLNQADEIFHKEPPLQLPYFKARYHYFKGLFHFYRSQSEQDQAVAYENLQAAFNIQKDLVAKGLDKEEHAAKSAYYLAYCLDDENPQKIELNRYVLPIFEKLQEKEPLFYLDGIAQIYNELGRIQSDSNPKQAVEYLSEARLAYQALEIHFPNEAFSIQSLLVVLLNLMDLNLKDPTMENSEEKIREFSQEVDQHLSRLKAADFSSYEDMLSTLEDYLASRDLPELKRILEDRLKKDEPLH